ncbi:MAG: hypothetical protein GF309_12590 [Candidatus Lokiarchaeota archaeon]|nr:hypothetical protein [Candidatus Lokiarchaeota archaeon]
MSLDKDIVAKIRDELPTNRSLSSVVEESLESMSSTMYLEHLGSVLDIDAKIMSQEDIISMRQKGAKAEMLIRELRDEA